MSRGIPIKGLGELTYLGVSAAIANAVFHATGKRTYDLPLTPGRVLG
jgi:xanthine dehydrogenase YagR molybdenum-binding subunit